MGKIKLFLINFVMFLYNEHIYEDFSVLTTIGKIIIYPAWFIRMVVIIVFSPLYLIDYFWKKSKLYKVFDDIIHMRNIDDDIIVNFTKSYVNKK